MCLQPLSMLLISCFSTPINAGEASKPIGDVDHSSTGIGNEEDERGIHLLDS